MAPVARLCALSLCFLATPAHADLAPLRPHELNFDVGESSGRSPDGRYSFVLDNPRGDQFRIVVRSRGIKQPIASMDFGAAHNLVVRFVDGHNLLASWSCGTYCTRAPMTRGESGAWAGAVLMKRTWGYDVLG